MLSCKNHGLETMSFGVKIRLMSAAEIIAELPKLTPEERRAVALRLREIEEEDDMRFLVEAADQAFLELDRMEAEDARRKTR